MLFKFCWQHIKPYKWPYLVMMMAPIFGACFPLICNYGLKLFVDAMVQDRDIICPALLIIFCHIVLEIFWRTSNVIEWHIIPKMRESIILSSYNYVQHHSYIFFQNSFAGSLTTKLRGILNGFDKFRNEMHWGLFQRVLTTVVSICALMFVNMYVGIFLIGWSVVFLCTVSLLSKKLNKLVVAETESGVTLAGMVSDNVTNIISLFAFSSRMSELSRLKRYVQSDLTPKSIASQKYECFVHLASGILFILKYVFLLFYIVHLKRTGLVTTSDFVFVVSMAFVISNEIWYVTKSMQSFVREMAEFKSCLSIVEVPHTSLDVKGAKPLAIQQPSIVFNDVWFGYDNVHFVLKNFSLSIKAGEKIGLVGESGAGKSTLVNLLLRYFELKRGNILIDGHDIAHVTQDSLRAHIAVIPQDTLLFHRSILENVRYGRFDATDEEIMQACQKAHIHDFIVQLPEGYQTEVGERGIKLSGGQRQRIAIARAMLKDAPILILDEATSALDSHTEKRIQESLNILIADTKKTVIAIAHRLSTLKHMDRIIFLENGQIIEQGSHQTLVKKLGGLYQKLWQQQTL